jgi:hypothetical protein
LRNSTGVELSVGQRCVTVGEENLGTPAVCMACPPARRDAEMGIVWSKHCGRRAAAGREGGERARGLVSACGRVGGGRRARGWCREVRGTGTPPHDTRESNRPRQSNQFIVRFGDAREKPAPGMLFQKKKDPRARR